MFKIGIRASFRFEQKNTTKDTIKSQRDHVELKGTLTYTTGGVQLITSETGKTFYIEKIQIMSQGTGGTYGFSENTSTATANLKVHFDTPDATTDTFEFDFYNEPLEFKSAIYLDRWGSTAVPPYLAYIRYTITGFSIK